MRKASREAVAGAGIFATDARKGTTAVKQDRLILLRQGFEVPAYPAKRFFCWHCALLDGLLASFPDLAKRLHVDRVAWPRPRQEVVALVGEENQSLPLLILAEGETSPHQTGVFEGRAFISDKDKILAALTDRHGFPELFAG
jgi:hypothetical protein